ncbi:hypothetical protein HMPREF0971_01549 [Segatella oris F0302]|uniref:Uncharacterized protein n=1 Tax=Segatella oris F0302 TaxID=649760 RepID=D1QRE5_9BACT|nr:hypothetical protein HMPREF0971_01549 [Segatella oris F0302]
MQCTDNQNITEIKANNEVKSCRKTLLFASNECITCFISSRHLMQIAM